MKWLWSCLGHCWLQCCEVPHSAGCPIKSREAFLCPLLTHSIEKECFSQLMAHSTATVFSFTFEHNSHLCGHVSFSLKFYFSVLTQGVQYPVTLLTPHIQSINTYFWDLPCDHHCLQSLLMSRQPSGHWIVVKFSLFPILFPQSHFPSSSHIDLIET